MNHKELIAKLASDLNLPKNEVELLLETFVSTSTDLLCELKTIGIQGFGSFEIRKKDERLSVHPSTQIRTLIPPKLVVNFRQSSVFKEKINVSNEQR